MLSVLSREELFAGLDAVVEEVLLNSGVEGPPIDAFALAKALGLTIATDDGQQWRARYVRLQNAYNPRPRGTILLSSDPRSERLHWAVAHEIGEHLAHQVFAYWGVDAEEAAPTFREQTANQFASRLLLPNAWFCADGEATGWDLYALKASYSTASHELIVRRLLERETPIIAAVFDHNALFWRRGNMPGRLPPSSAEENACRAESHATNRPCEYSNERMRIRVWPIHEADWKREIVYVEMNEYAEGAVADE